MIRNDSGINLAGKIEQLANLQFNMNLSQVDVHLNIVNSDRIDNIHSYSVDYFRSVGLGTESDKGLLFVAAVDTEKITVQVITGYGLEGDLNDGKIGRVLDSHSIQLVNNGTDSLIDYIYSVTNTLCNDIQGSKCREYAGQSFGSSIGNGATGGGGAVRTYTVKPIDTGLDCKPCERLDALDIKVNSMLGRITTLETNSGSGGGSDDLDYITSKIDRIYRSVSNIERLDYYIKDTQSRVVSIEGTMSNLSYHISDISRDTQQTKYMLMDFLYGTKSFNTGQYDLPDTPLYSSYDSSEILTKIELILDKLNKPVLPPTSEIIDYTDLLNSLNQNLKNIETPLKELLIKTSEVLEEMKNSSEFLENILQSILQNLLDFEIDLSQITNEAGTNLWDFLGGFFDKIIDLIDSLLDKIIYLVIPEDTSFIGEGFDSLNATIQNKFQALDIVKTTMIGAFSPQETKVPDWEIDLPVYGTITAIDSTWVDKALPMFKQFVSAIIYMFTAIWAYKKITNDLIT